MMFPIVNLPQRRTKYKPISYRVYVTNGPYSWLNVPSQPCAGYHYEQQILSFPSEYPVIQESLKHDVAHLDAVNSSHDENVLFLQENVPLNYPLHPRRRGGSRGWRWSRCQRCGCFSTRRSSLALIRNTCVVFHVRVNVTHVIKSVSFVRVMLWMMMSMSHNMFIIVSLRMHHFFDFFLGRLGFPCDARHCVCCVHGVLFLWDDRLPLVEFVYSCFGDIRRARLK